MTTPPTPPRPGRRPSIARALATAQETKDGPRPGSLDREKILQTMVEVRDLDPIVVPEKPAGPPPRPGARRRRWPWAVAGAVLAVAAVVAALVFSPVLAIRDINVTGTVLAPPEEVDRALSPLKGTSLALVDKNQVLKDLADVVQIKDVTIEAQPPSTLNVAVHERVEAALLEADGQFITIDSKGVELRTLAQRSEAQLPLLAGGRAAIGQPSFAMLSEVMASLPPAVLGQLDRISASSPNSVQLQLLDGAAVVWGDATQSELKARILQTLLSQRLSQGVREYDVSTPERPLTKENVPPPSPAPSAPATPDVPPEAPPQ